MASPDEVPSWLVTAKRIQILFSAVLFIGMVYWMYQVGVLSFQIEYFTSPSVWHADTWLIVMGVPTIVILYFILGRYFARDS